MNAVKMLFTTVLALSILIAFFLIKYSFKCRTMPGAKPFVLMLICAVFYNGAYIGEINSSNLVTAMFWYNIEHIFIPIQQYLWFVMSLEYININKKYFNVFKYIMLYYPISYIVIYFTNSFHKLYVSSIQFISNGFFYVIITTKGPLFIALVVSGTLLAFICTVSYAYIMVNSPRLHRHNYIIMFIASVFPWISVYLNTANVNFLGIDYFPVVSIFSGILYMQGLFYYRIFNVVPIATEMVFRQSKEAVAIIDITNRIVDINNSFLWLFPELKNLSGKQTLDIFIAANCELNDVLQKKIVFEKNISNKQYYFSAEINDIIREDDISAGKLLVIRDVTLFVENQNHLELLATNAINKAQTNEISFLQAQIEPHFLNNTLSVISSMIISEPQEAKKLIGNLSEYLMSRCYFDSTSEMISLEKELEIIETYVSIEKARFGQRLNYILEYNGNGQVLVPKLILQPLVENAIRHGILKKSLGGIVKLIIFEYGCNVCFEVCDDGVGFDKEKLDNIDKGNEQSIGLCNIKKRLLRYYGEGISIISSPYEGTKVAFSIPIKQNIEVKVGAKYND